MNLLPLALLFTIPTQPLHYQSTIHNVPANAAATARTLTFNTTEPDLLSVSLSLVVDTATAVTVSTSGRNRPGGLQVLGTERTFRPLSSGAFTTSFVIPVNHWVETTLVVSTVGGGANDLISLEVTGVKGSFSTVGAGFGATEATCLPALGGSSTCLGACLADGSVTINLPAGQYLVSVHGETTWVRSGATTLATGGNIQLPGFIYEHVSSGQDYACRSAGGTGLVCFTPCL